MDHIEVDIQKKMVAVLLAQSGWREHPSLEPLNHQQPGSEGMCVCVLAAGRVLFYYR